MTNVDRRPTEDGSGWHPDPSGLVVRLGAVCRFADLCGGPAYVLHAPMMLPTRAVADGLRAEQSVAQTMAKIRDVDVAILGGLGHRSLRAAAGSAGG